jgi:hypothetical protein
MAKAALDDIVIGQMPEVLRPAVPCSDLMRLAATYLGQGSVVEAITPNLPGVKADNLAPILVSPEIRENAQTRLVQIIGNRTARKTAAAPSNGMLPSKTPE